MLVELWVIVLFKNFKDVVVGLFMVFIFVVIREGRFGKFGFR